MHTTRPAECASRSKVFEWGKPDSQWALTPSTEALGMSASTMVAWSINGAGQYLGSLQLQS